MDALAGLIRSLESVNSALLRVGRFVAWVAVALMVVVILLQVVFRYLLNNALPWPDEAARFLMLWMTGLMAPSAYRWGGFVSIEMIKDFLGRRLAVILNLAILVLSLTVLIIALWYGWDHIQRGWRFMSSSLYVPLNLIGMKALRVPLAYMYMSLPVGFVLMVLVNVELMLKNVHMLFDAEAEYGQAPDQMVISAE